MTTRKTKKRNQRNLTVIIITTITVLSWIGFEAYHSYVTTKIKPETRTLLNPLRPSLEKEILTQLEEKIGLPREEIKKMLPQPSALTLGWEASPSSNIDLEEPRESSATAAGGL